MTTRRHARRKFLCLLLFAALAAMSVPTLAAAQAPQPWAAPLVLAPDSDATLYEATENMKLIGRSRRSEQPTPRFRKATSHLMGVARRGSPLCPDGVPGTGNCTINATGHDNVDLGTGLGSLDGTVTVVVQDPNLVDSPEFIVMRGTFSGRIDFRPALDPVQPLPFGTAAGRLQLRDERGHRRTFPFTGIFRQPVDVGVGVPVYFTPTVPGMFSPVQPNEFALSFAAVRFEISFDPLDPGVFEHEDDD